MLASIEGALLRWYFCSFFESNANIAERERVQKVWYCFLYGMGLSDCECSIICTDGVFHHSHRVCICQLPLAVLFKSIDFISHIPLLLCGIMWDLLRGPEIGSTTLPLPPRKPLLIMFSCSSELDWTKEVCKASNSGSILQSKPLAQST